MARFTRRGSIRARHGNAWRFHDKILAGRKHALLQYVGIERGRQLWAKNLSDGREYPITDLSGRPGRLGWDMDIDAAGEYIYFTWWEETGDIWVMDVSTEDD